ncbi:2-hydroxyacid dehydrogenase [Nocardioides szechwanensis]|uniref:Phosphoglycerate dehydrogenase n=1 Tax=Nocardioides szechwanensis TaxID=1005944 RepID=A0A1G9Z2S8_9ACTN|nr:D-2-hydroxyacid dehydrogenase family protein [Nocardioides szechwanensis]GEP33795.1 2-hydroxyacid dehydrogenase [Nocardioides szechwanensis]SDN15654.1 Phosphoglycerate dehydrogenase [Nocardioides szechwanensis]
MRCVILDDYQQVATSYADWSLLDGAEVTSVSEHLEGETLVDALAGAAVVIVMRERTPVTSALLDRLPELRLVVTSGMRNAAIDLDACRERGIAVCGTTSRSTPPVELTWALVLGLVRHLGAESTAFREGGPWQSTVGVDLAGATLGVVGLGKIGRRVADIGRAFGMEVLGWSPHLTDERAAEAGARRAGSLAELMAAADVVTLHLVLSDSTRGLVGAPELAAMRPSAYLVNTSRAGLVDTDALLDALRAGRIAGAGLDVFDEEPLPTDHPLRSLPQVLATPHLGYVTAANYRTYFAEAVEDVAAWLAGTPTRLLT